MSETLVQLTDIHKSFGGVKALQGASLKINAGEVHALLGENGAGKSTLMNILGGSLSPDSGEIHLNDQDINFKNPREAQLNGISVVHQEMALAKDLTVSENVFLSELSSVINWKQLNLKTSELISQLGFDISPNVKVENLSVAHQQVVEIAKALSHHSKVVVFDEPTAVLSVQDANRLIEVIRKLRYSGVGIIYISHRLDEVFKIADRITVLKDGATVKTLETKETSIQGVIELMVGRELSAMFGEDIKRELGDVVIDVSGIPFLPSSESKTFQVREGEILGLGGLVGSGRTELVRQIFGADNSANIKVKIKQKDVSIKNPLQGIKAGVALVPEDRKGQGVVLDIPIKWNITMAKMSMVTRVLGFINGKKENSLVDKLGKALRLKAGSVQDPVSSLSGGNQQKVVLAKWLHAGGEVLILDEPTRGVDVGAKTEIYTLIKQLAAEGKAIIVISSEHLELFGLCDRVLVMREGEITGELQPEDYTETNMLNLAMA